MRLCALDRLASTGSMTLCAAVLLASVMLVLTSSAAALASATIYSSEQVSSDAFSLYSDYPQVFWSTGTLLEGVHTVQLKRVGTGTLYINLDAVDIWGTIQ